MTASIMTLKGDDFSFADVEANRIDIEEIAHVLANLCRFGGHVNQFYSVAQHSLYVSGILPPHLALQGLLHDAAEAFLVDVPRPIKLILPEYRALEKRVEAHLFPYFGFYELHPEVKKADLVLLATERRDLTNYIEGQNEPWPVIDSQPKIEPMAVRINPLNPVMARELFLRRYYQLCE